MQPEQSNLGQKTQYESQYNPKLLFPIERATKRAEINLDIEVTPMFGHDIWTHYEVSWLNSKGKPQVAIAIITIPSQSPFLIESKSLKLYFNSFNQTVYQSWSALENIITRDLSDIAHMPVAVTLYPLVEAPIHQTQSFKGLCLDDLDIDCTEYQPNSSLLFTHKVSTEECLYSDLLKSNCLVTNQPDWGSVQIIYQGEQIDHKGLLAYIISFREHNEFHEQCIERIFNDILVQCNPKRLTIVGRYTRRGGLDINPVRSTHPIDDIDIQQRLIRQ